MLSNTRIEEIVSCALPAQFATGMEAMGSTQAKIRATEPRSDGLASVLQPRFVAKDPAAYASEEAFADRSRTTA